MLDSEPPKKPSGVDALPVFGPSFKVYDSHWPEIRARALALGIVSDEQEPQPMAHAGKPVQFDSPSAAHPEPKTKDSPAVLPIPDTKRLPIAAIEVENGG